MDAIQKRPDFGYALRTYFQWEVPLKYLDRNVREVTALSKCDKGKSCISPGLRMTNNIKVYSLIPFYNIHKHQSYTPLGLTSQQTLGCVPFIHPAIVVWQLPACTHSSAMVCPAAPVNLYQAFLTNPEFQWSHLSPWETVLTFVFDLSAESRTR